MFKASLVVPEYLQGNKIFDKELHRDDIYHRFNLLAVELEKKGIKLATCDIHGLDESSFILYASNMPKLMPVGKQIDKAFLILSESEFIRPDNYDTSLHKYFKKIFTWNDQLVDSKKYFKLNYSHKFPDSIERVSYKDKKLCVLIAGNKKARRMRSQDLYNEREVAIRWFERNAPNSFDLYGVGWNRHMFGGNIFLRQLNRFSQLCRFYQLIFRTGYSSYRGVVENKISIMSRYKFSICYENACGIPGYITEKIFDSFFSGCVPVYWGAPNVTEHIPESCFIDRRKFNSNDELYGYLKSMSEVRYQAYLDSIEAFLSSKDSNQFTSKGFVEMLMSEILDGKFGYDNC